MSTKFWNLYHPASQKKLADWAPKEVVLESVKCSASKGHQGPGKRLTDLSVTLPGNSVDSFVWTWVSDCLLQDHVLDSFRTHGLTGYEVKTCKVRFKNDIGKQPPRLWELVVTGWGGMARPESGIKLVQHCEACQLRRYSAVTDVEKLIDETQWDGNDFFMVWPLPKFVFITDRVAQIVRSANFTGIQIRAISDVKFSANGFGPGRLSYRMPDDRAKELGSPLGIY